MYQMPESLQRPKEESPVMKMPDSPATVEELPTPMMPTFSAEESPPTTKIPLTSLP